MKKFIATAYAALAATMFMTAPTLASTGEKELDEIPYLSEISAAGFNVHMRKSETPDVPVAPKTSPTPKPRPQADTKTTGTIEAPYQPKAAPGGKTVLTLSDDGMLIVNGVKSFYLKPGPVKVDRNVRKTMESVQCAREGASKIGLGYMVYSRDNLPLGYMADYKLRAGSHFESFRVITFPGIYGKSVCLEFDGTNPHPDSRVGNQPKVKVTIDEIRSSLPF